MMEKKKKSRPLDPKGSSLVIFGTSWQRQSLTEYRVKVKYRCCFESSRLICLFFCNSGRPFWPALLHLHLPSRGTCAKLFQETGRHGDKQAAASSIFCTLFPALIYRGRK